VEKKRYRFPLQHPCGSFKLRHGSLPELTRKLKIQ
jgi:hypothetical protein